MTVLGPLVGGAVVAIGLLLDGKAIDSEPDNIFPCADRATAARG